MTEEKEKKKEESSLKKVPHEILEAAYKTGFDSEEEKRSGSYLFVDESPVVSTINKRFEGKLEMLDTKKALEKYPWLEDYRWSLIDPDKDEYTKKVEEQFQGGYFIRILPGAEVEFPLQSCMMMSENRMRQRVHNIIIAEEGSKARIITGCATHPDAETGQHIGVSEFFIKENASLNFTMIHHWGKQTEVIPRTVSKVGKNAEFVSNYVLLSPVKRVQSYPMVKCEGENARVGMNSILYAQNPSTIDVGAGIEFNAPGCRGEIVSRAISRKGSHIIARGIMKGRDSPAKGHLECQGLVMDDNSSIHAVPELVGARQDLDLSHEAAVGKIAEKEIAYLMSRGLSREKATSIIVRGFLDVDILGLPEDLEKDIRETVNQMADAL